MANRNSFEVVIQPLTANGDATGFLQVEDPTRFPVGISVGVNRAGVVTQCIVVGYGSSPASIRVKKLDNTHDFTGFLIGDAVVSPPQTVADQIYPDTGRLIPGLTHVVSISGVDAPVTLVGGVLYRVVTDTDCWLKVGSAAVASTDMYLVAKIPEVFCFGHLGSTPVLHAITGGGAGKLYVTPMIPTLDS